MKCVNCGERDEPKDGRFTCPRCTYTQPMPRTWELTGLTPLAPRYRPAVDVVVVNVWGEQISAGKL